MNTCKVLKSTHMVSSMVWTLEKQVIQRVVSVTMAIMQNIAVQRRWLSKPAAAC